MSQHHQDSSGGGGCRMPASLMTTLRSVEFFAEKMLCDSAAAGLNVNSSKRKNRGQGAKEAPPSPPPPRCSSCGNDLGEVDGRGSTNSSTSGNSEKNAEDDVSFIPSVDHFASLLPGESEEDGTEGAPSSCESRTNQTKQVAIEVYALLHHLYKEVQTAYNEAAVATPPATATAVMPSSAEHKKKKEFDPYPLPRPVSDDVANVRADHLATNPGRFLSAVALLAVKNTYLPSGGTIQFPFDAERRLLRVHSGAIECTVGTLEAILEYNAVGPSRVTRQKLKLCPHFELLMAKAVKKKQSDIEQIAVEHNPLPVKEELVLGHDICPTGCHCPYVHLAATKDEDGEPGVVLGQFRHNYVHWRNVRSSLEGYECFDPGLTLPLAEPNGRGEAINTDTSTIFVTQGAREFLSKRQAEKTPQSEDGSSPPALDFGETKEFVPGEHAHVAYADGDAFGEEEDSTAPEEQSDTSSMTSQKNKEPTEMQHCADYKHNGVCHLGPTCKFVHALGTEEEEAAILAQHVAAEGKRGGGYPAPGSPVVVLSPPLQHPHSPVRLLPAPPPRASPGPSAAPAPLEPWAAAENHHRSSAGFRQSEKQQLSPQRPMVPSSAIPNTSGRTIRFLSTSNGSSETPLSQQASPDSSPQKNPPLLIPPSPESPSVLTPGSSVVEEPLTIVSRAPSHQNLLESQAKHGVDALGFDTLNNYAILQELGRGNFGKVMLACDLEGNQVAIKSMSCGVKAPRHRFARIASTRFQPRRRNSVSSQGSQQPSLAGSQQYVRTGSHLSLASAQTPAETMVMREVAIMKKLRHKNIVQLKEVIHDEEDDQTHLVMDYICNGPLAEVSSSGVCTSNILTIGDLDACKDYIRQAAKGLEYLHRQGIVHRDVKPENLLVGSEKDCYIADFGVSAVLRDNKVVDVTAGTQSFFSPELLRGDYEEAAKYGEQSDVWALGVTLYAIVFGKLPFIATNIMALAHSVLHDPVPFPEGDSSHHPLQHVFEGVLHKDPSKRWSLVKFRHALRKRNSHGLASRLRSEVGDRQGAASQMSVQLANDGEHEEKDHNGDGEGTTLMNYPLVGLSIGAAGMSCSSDTPSSDHDGAEVVVTEEEVQQAIVTSRVSFFRPSGTTVAAPRRFDSTNTFILNSEDGDYSCGGGI